MYIDPKAIIGKKFFVANDASNTEYECIGYSDSGTLLIITTVYDSTSNRSYPKTFKLTEVRFFGKITTS